MMMMTCYYLFCCFKQKTGKEGLGKENITELVKINREKRVYTQIISEESNLR